MSPLEQAAERGKSLLSELLDASAEETASAALVAVAGDAEAPPAARVAASNSILDRTRGKPKETVEVQGAGRLFMATPEFMAALASLNKDDSPAA